MAPVRRALSKRNRKRTKVAKAVKAVRNKHLKRSNLRSPPLLDVDLVLDDISFVRLHENQVVMTTPPRVLEDDIYKEFSVSDSVKKHKLVIEKEKQCQVSENIKGNRIVEINYFSQQLAKLQQSHSQNCSVGVLLPEDEKKTGLRSTILFKCNFCDKVFKIETENPDKESEINNGAVWGTLAVGSSFSHLEEILSSLNIPTLSKYFFNKIENKLFKIWTEELLLMMEAAGQEERRIAIEKNRVDDVDGIPWISVYCDAGWSKRSYGHNYNANSGVGVIIGRETKKVLYIGVRNKYCVQCARAANKSEEHKPHVCFRNWNSSSSAMESDIIVEGFKSSIKMHNLKFKEFVADGDSSVYAKIRQEVSYGHEVKKLECINHAIKNYGKALYKIKCDVKISPSHRKIMTVALIKKLQEEAKKVIYANGDVRTLQTELKKSVEVAIPTKQLTFLKTSSVYNHILGAVELLIKKAPRLIKSETNNRAECFMNIVARFTAGKRLNLIQKNSFEMRTCLAGMRYNKGVRWHISPWKKIQKSSPGVYFKKYISRYERNAQSRNQVRKTRRKLVFPQNRNRDYGKNAEEPALNKEEFKLEEERILNSLQVNKEEQINIEQNTKGQFENNKYIFEKKFRLTASNFGNVSKRRATTPPQNLLKTILSQKPFSCAATEYGKIKEEVVRKRFEREQKLSVENSGLWVDQEYGFLGASPDGLIMEDAIIEIKCAYALSNNLETWEEVVKKQKNLCIQKHGEGVRLRRSHNYYYQIQGQLHITGRKKCYFILYKNDESDLYIEEIKRDNKFWDDKMKNQLVKFYKECLLPEIIIRINNKK